RNLRHNFRGGIKLATNNYRQTLAYALASHFCKPFLAIISKYNLDTRAAVEFVCRHACGLQGALVEKNQVLHMKHLLLNSVAALVNQHHIVAITITRRHIQNQTHLENWWRRCARGDTGKWEKADGKQLEQFSKSSDYNRAL